MESGRRLHVTVYMGCFASGVVLTARGTGVGESWVAIIQPVSPRSYIHTLSLSRGKDQGRRVAVDTGVFWNLEASPDHCVPGTLVKKTGTVMATSGQRW